uniref:3-ketoacyl-CoA synthase n=1 Tax=Salix viminalis TaxID=40686 RepID=A0A6N2M5X4_SALVM
MADEKNKSLLSQPLLEREKSNLPNTFLYVKLKYVKLGYHYLVSNAMYLTLMPVLCMIFAHLSTFTVDELWNRLKFNLVTVLLSSTSIVFTATLYFMSRPRKVYLVDFSCYKPGPSHIISRELVMQLSAASAVFTEQSLAFQKKILEKSGFGEMTYAPKGAMQVPPDQSMAESWRESEMVMFGAIDDLLAKTGVKPRDIGILVVNSSLFNPTPSLSARIVNHYKLRGNILSYNLGGMGCSAGLISVDLAKDLLQVHPNSYALVVSTENITRNWIFDRRRSKYQLMRTVRTHKGADDKSFNCVLQREDPDTQRVGVSLSKDLMVIAGEALKTNITTLGPLVLPVSEQLLFFVTLVAKKVFKMKIKPYIPDFKLAFEHFCIHAGGRGVLDELEKNLELTEWHMEPSRMTLYRFGNTSSSSLWYELAYSEAKGRIKKGDRIWQIGFGSGFKCNSAVWRAMRAIDPAKEKNPWMDEIDEFPVRVPKVAPLVY